MPKTGQSDKAPLSVLAPVHTLTVEYLHPPIRRSFTCASTLFPVNWVHWVSEGLRNLPDSTQPNSDRDGIWATMYIFTKEIKAQVNEQANGILEEGRRTERKKTHRWHNSSGNNSNNQIPFILVGAKDINQFWDHFSRLPLDRMRTWHCEYLREDIYEKLIGKCRVWQVLFNGYWAFSFCQVLSICYGFHASLITSVFCVIFVLLMRNWGLGKLNELLVIKWDLNLDSPTSELTLLTVHVLPCVKVWPKDFTTF